MRERGLGPTFFHDCDGFFEGLAVALLVLDGRAVWTPESLVLAGLVATANTAFDAAAADHVERCDLLREPHRMMPDDDVGGLP